MKKKVLFIINPISGTAAKDQIPEKIEKYLDNSIFDYEIKNTEYAGHATLIAKNAADAGTDIVVAIGGDGTVNEVARSLIHTQTALGIIPSGSGNGLARHLLLPLNIRKSIEIINRCEIHELDYGVINDYPFFCTCGMGFDAFVSQKFAETGKRGAITYIQKVLEEGVRYKPETYEISTEGDTTKYKAFLISCANASQYGNNAYIAPQASMSDGLMDVIIMEPFDVLEAPQIAIDMFSKTLDKSSKIKTFQTKHLHIHRSQPGVIHYDGDPVESGEDIDIHLEEKGIRIIVNPEGDKSLRQPNAIQTAAAELFNEINDIRQGIARHTLRGIALTKLIQKKIERRLPGI
ncbi:MAG: diacylglycerol kinase family lipid kinase [Prevotella sp.]|nr:diacylglycerol kinase family lipid kinase [Prevotella sp.]